MVGSFCRIFLSHFAKVFLVPLQSFKKNLDCFEKSHPIPKNKINRKMRAYDEPKTNYVPRGDQ